MSLKIVLSAISPSVAIILSFCLFFSSKSSAVSKKANSYTELGISVTDLLQKNSLMFFRSEIGLVKDAIQEFLYHGISNNVYHWNFSWIKFYKPFFR